MLALTAKAFVMCEAESRDRKMLPSKFLNFFEESITEAVFPASPGAHQYRVFCSLRFLLLTLLTAHLSKILKISCSIL